MTNNDYLVYREYPIDSLEEGNIEIGRDEIIINSWVYEFDSPLGGKHIRIRLLIRKFKEDVKPAKNTVLDKTNYS